MDRFCPNCKIKLGKYDHFFCTSCGAALPNDLVKHERDLSRVADFAKEVKKPVSKQDSTTPNIYANVKPVLIGLSVITVLGILLFVFQSRIANFIFQKTPAKQLTVNQTPVYTKNIVEVPLEWEVNTFGVEHSIEYVPFDAEIVIEGNDLAKMTEEYVKIDPAYGDLQSFIHKNADQHFVMFATKSGATYVWSLIYYPQSPTQSIPAALIEKYSWLKFWRNSPIVLVTTNDDVLTKVADAKGKTARNFTQTPLYAASKAALPKNGKMMIFVTSKEARDYLKTVIELPGVSDVTKKVVQSVVESNSDYSVVL